MYQSHFGLTAQPFKITPDTRRFFVGAQRGAALEALVYTIVAGEGIIKLVGEVGSGKTTLCRMLEDRLPDNVETVYLANPSLSRDDILHAIAMELGIALPPGCSRIDILQTLQSHLLQRHAQGQRVVVFVEEAQGMPLETLEEIRFISNLETREEKLLQVVLFGQPELDQRLGGREVRQLRDRITHSFTLPPLSLQDTRDYLMYRLRTVGYQGSDLFSPHASRLLTRYSGGMIRRIHILADKALLAAFAEGCSRVTARHLRQARADSEISPWWSRYRLQLGGVAAAITLVTSGLLAWNLWPAPAPESLAAVNLSQKILAAETSEVSQSTFEIATRDVPEASVVATRIAASKHFIASGAGHYTIQIMVTDGPQTHGLEKLLNRDDMREHKKNVFLYKTRLNGIDRWSVLYGNFRDARSAKQALGLLPRRLTRFGPYIRSVDFVRQDVESTRQEVS